MLKYLDVLIGLSTVMLLASMVVMAVTHFIMTSLNARGSHLITGLSQLLAQINPDLSRDVAKRIATSILKSDNIKSPWGRCGTVVHREEFIRAVLTLASDTRKLAQGDRDALNGMLEKAGIKDPKQTLEDVHSMALELEIQYPEVANNVRYNLAILQQAESKFVNRVHAWFDRTMDRASERFKYHSQVVTCVISLLIAGAFQLDTIQIVNRLTTDEAARQAIVATATEAMKNEAVIAAGQNKPQTQTDQEIANYSSRMIAATGLVPVPRTRAEYMKGWTDNWMSRLSGVLLSTVLLSLGAPFWYKALGNLLRFRSVAAQKDDAQRAARATQPEPVAAAAAAGATQTTAPSWLVGEQGNPQLVG